MRRSTGDCLRILSLARGKKLRFMTAFDQSNKPSQPPSPPFDKGGSTTTEGPGEQDAKFQHPIASAIDTFLHRMRDIEESARAFIPLAAKERRQQFNSVKTELSDLQSQLGQLTDLLRNEKTRTTQADKVNQLLDAVRRGQRLKNSNMARTLEFSLFLGMFSAYDTFSGDLLAALYRKKPELFRKIKREIPVADILQYDSFEELKTKALQDEIESFRRKSYVEQFEDLKKRFDTKDDLHTLMTFERWPQFVECTQRRNLITHSNGIVSTQYLSVCQKAGYSFDPPINAGDKLSLGSKYFRLACDMMMEAALKLGQTLWRKLLPKELAEADRHLRKVVFDCLKMEMWERAQTYGHFAISQKKMVSDLKRKMDVINYAIALKFGGKPDQAARILATQDWSATVDDLRLAEAVLSDRYDDAATLMRKIGQNGQIIEASYYYSWPLFNTFRETEQFLDAYESVFGRPFVVDLQETTASVQADTVEEFEKRPDQLERDAQPLDNQVNSTPEDNEVGDNSDGRVT